MRRRGRPQAKYRCADGSEIQGLSRQRDGRWRISRTGEIFFAADEYEALAHFRAALAKLRGRDRVELPLEPQTDTAAALAAAREAGATTLAVDVGPKGEPPTYSVLVGGPAFYAAVRQWS